MNPTVFNGRQPPSPHQRKQLSDQLDRFDLILDGLAEGLQGAITDAARDGTRMAVKDAICEVMNDPTLRAVFEKLAQPVPEKPTLRARIQAKFARAKAAIVEATAPAVRAAADTVRAVTDPVVGVARAVGSVWEWKKPVLIGAGIGLAVTVVSLAATHGFAAVVAGVGATVTAVTVQLGQYLRKTALKLRMI